MSNDTNNGGPAFPGQWYDFQPCTGEQVVREQWDGMTLRDYFAARMMVSELAKEIRPHEPYNYLNAATRAYRMADAMLKAREAGND